MFHFILGLLILGIAFNLLATFVFIEGESGGLGFFLLMIGGTFTVLGLFGGSPNVVPNQDPRVGWTVVSHTNGEIRKVCDGTTLLYSNRTKTNNSTECQPAKK